MSELTEADHHRAADWVIEYHFDGALPDEMTVATECVGDESIRVLVSRGDEQGGEFILTPEQFRKGSPP